MNKLDFGSGYNPVDGFKTCDINGYVDYYFDPISYKVDTDDKFDYIRCRNVIHHIKDLDKLSNEFYRLLNDGGVLEIIDVREEYYSENYYLDYLWYRYVIPRYEVWFCNQYRDCRNYFKNFVLEYYKTEDEKETFFYKKCKRSYITTKCKCGIKNFWVDDKIFNDDNTTLECGECNSSCEILKKVPERVFKIKDIMKRKRVSRNY